MPIVRYGRDASDNPVAYYRSQELEQHPIIKLLAGHSGFVTLARQKYPHAPMTEALAETFHQVWKAQRDADAIPEFTSLEQYFQATLNVAELTP